MMFRLVKNRYFTFVLFRLLDSSVSLENKKPARNMIYIGWSDDSVQTVDTSFGMKSGAYLVMAVYKAGEQRTVYPAKN